MTDVTVTTEPPAVNTPEARDSTGTLIDQTPATTTPTPPKANDPSFLNGDAPKEGEAPKEGDAPKEPQAPQGAPEKYEDFKLPDGYKFDNDTLTNAQAVFKDLNLPQDAAQKLVDFYAKNALAASEAPYKAWADLQKEWTTEIGNRFGTRSEAVRTDINRAISATLPPTLAKNFKSALDLTGAGSNPDIVEALSIMLKGLGEGTPVPGGKPSPAGQVAPDAGPVTPAEAIYGHLRK